MLLRKRVSGPGKERCVICKNKQCLDEQQVIRQEDPIIAYSGPITRKMSKLLKITNEVAIYEVYRCMPLLGDEKNNVPDWDVHTVHYAVIFSGH